MNQDDNTPKSATQTITPSHSPESEPFRYHFDQGQESSSLPESKKPEQSSQFNEQANNPYATTPIKAPNNIGQSIPNTPSNIISNAYKPPDLPLTEAEIEAHVHDKDSNAAMHWLALWCLRQLEIYEQSLK